MAGGVPAGKPEDAGMSSERLARIHEAVERHIDAGEISGAVTLVARRGRIDASSLPTIKHLPVFRLRQGLNILPVFYTFENTLDLLGSPFCRGSDAESRRMTDATFATHGK